LLLIHDYLAPIDSLTFCPLLIGTSVDWVSRHKPLTLLSQSADNGLRLQGYQGDVATIEEDGSFGLASASHVNSQPLLFSLAYQASDGSRIRTYNSQYAVGGDNSAESDVKQFRSHSLLI
jgi:hypothetical protein